MTEFFESIPDWVLTLVVVVFGLLVVAVIASLLILVVRAVRQGLPVTVFGIRFGGDSRADGEAAHFDQDDEQPADASQVSPPPRAEVEASPESETGSEAGATDAESADDPILTAAIASHRNDLEAVREALSDAWVSGASSDSDRRLREATRFQLLASAGDRTAVSSLTRLVDDNPEEPLLLQHLATALAAVGDNRAAERAIAERLEELPREQRSDLSVRRSKLLRQIGDLAAAEEAGRSAVADSADANSLADAQKELATVLFERGQISEGLILLEKVLVDNPTDRSARFSLAYQYDQAELGSLAIAHGTAIRNSVDPGSGALNNLGVALAKADLNLEAARAYEAGLEKGSGLAGTNLAYVAIRAGLGDTAAELIERARTAEPDEPTVNSVSQDLVTKRRRQREQMAELVADGEAARQTMLHIGQLLPTELPTGTWQFDDTGDRITFEANPEGSRVTGRLGDVEDKIVAGRTGNLLEIEYRVSSYRTVKGIGAASGGELIMLVGLDNKAKRLVASRVEA